MQKHFPGFLVTIFLIFQMSVQFNSLVHAQSNKDLVGIWEGRKVDGRFNTTEPWGPFEFKLNQDGSLSGKFLGSRLGRNDTEMYNVTLNENKFHLQMNRWGGAKLDGKFSPEKGIVGTLKHHGMTEDLTLYKIPNRSDRDILNLLTTGKLATNPPYQSEFMSVLIHQGVDKATQLQKAVHAVKPDHKIWGPSSVNNYGYKLLGEGKNKKAISVLKLNTMAYPEDANSWDSLGEAYMKNGDRDLAIAALKKSLSLKPKQNVRQNSMKLLKELGVNLGVNGI